jgi:hypothetical protein
VFVANPINDFEYPLLKANSFDLQNIQGYFVATTTNQNIDGEKTFLVSPRVPTATNASGTQVVNIDRLNTDISTNNATINAAINATNVTIANLATTLANNYVALAGTQTITGSKTFSNISVPLNPAANNSPVSLNYFDSNAVLSSSDQIINGTKTFNNSPQVPNPDSGGDAVNYQTLLNAIDVLTNPNVSGGCIKLGFLQIVFGFVELLGTWDGPVRDASVSYSAIAPNMSPFTSVAGGGSSIDRLLTFRSNFTNTNAFFSADNIPGSGTEAPNALVRFVVIGYI